MSDGAMRLAPWLVLAALAALGAADQGGIVVHAGTADYPAAQELSTPEDATPTRAQEECPPGCTCVAADLRLFFCGDQQLKYLDNSKGSFMEVVCQDAPLNCSALPALPARRRGALQRVEVTSCALPPSLPLVCATGGEGSRALTLRGALSSVSADNVRALDAEDLFLDFTPGTVQEFPAAAVKALPRLRVLRLLQGSVLRLHEDMFRGAPPLTYLEIGMSGVLELPSNTFRGLHALRNLSLWGNDITDVSIDAFNGLESLEKLALSRNPLVSLPPRALARARRLRTLLLDDVRLTELTEGVLEGLPYLQHVEVSSSEPLQLRTRAFCRLPALHSLAVTGSRVTSLPPDLFQGSATIVRLDLSHNRIAEIPREVFSNLSSLQTLDLSSNQLDALSHRQLLPLVSLRTLLLDRNNLRELPDYTFTGLGKLESVSLAHNQLVYISPVSFTDAASLLHLTLSHNRLAWEPSDLEWSSPFNMLHQLQTLDLSYNQISVVYSDWRVVLAHLAHLDLSHNNLTQLSQADMQFLFSTEVDLSHNAVSAVQPRAPWEERRQGSGARLTLAHNPFHCDCLLYDFITQVQAGEHKYQVEGCACASPRALAAQPLREVDPRQVTCPLEEVSPGCSCLLRPALDRAECVCNNTQVPDISETGVSHATLQLTRAPAADELQHLPPHVRRLSLAGLALQSVPLVPSTVYHLDLSHNNLTAVPAWLWHQNTSLSLARNQLACRCADTERVLLLQEHSARVADYINVTCAGGAPMAQLDARALCDVYRSTLAGVLIALAILLLALLGALLHHYWVDVQVFLYSRRWCVRLLPRETLDPDKKYDVFVSFARSDEQFVLRELLPRLERRYVVHVQDRDWVVGNTIPAEIHRSVEESRRTLILLSRSFCSSVWAAEEFRAVHAQATGDRRLRAVVVLTDLPHHEIDKESRVLLSLCRVLRYQDSRFWDKLQYALPRNPAAAPLQLCKGEGLHVVLNQEGQLVNRGYVKDV